MKRAEQHKDKTIFQALKTISNPFDLIAFLFAYRAKELFIALAIGLIVIMKYPQIINLVEKIYK